MWKGFFLLTDIKINKITLNYEMKCEERKLRMLNVEREKLEMRMRVSEGDRVNVKETKKKEKKL